MKRSEAFRAGSAIAMLLSGISLSIAGFCVEPVGEISDSVLWYVAQALIYAGSAFGIDVIIDRRIKETTDKADERRKS